MKKYGGGLKVFRIQVIAILVLMIITLGYSNKEPIRAGQVEMRIDGRVVNGDGKPIPGVSISLSMLKEGYVGYTPVDYPMIVTDKEGRYRFQNLEAGPFEVKYPDGSMGTYDVEEPINLELGTYKVEATPVQYGLSLNYWTVTYVKKFLTGEMELPDRGKETYYLNASVEGIEYKGGPMTLPDISLEIGGDIMLIMEKEEVEKLEDKDIMGGYKVKGFYSLLDANGKRIVDYQPFGNLLITCLVAPGKYSLEVFGSRLFKDQVFKDVVVSPGMSTQIKVPSP